jgi:hypothetical protein
MFDLVEIELTRVRKMAELTNDDLLIYLIDVAIIEANTKARSLELSSDLTREKLGFPEKTRAILQVVR